MMTLSHKVESLYRWQRFCDTLMPGMAYAQRKVNAAAQMDWDRPGTTTTGILTDAAYCLDSTVE